jgi:hypothetical protein
MSISRRVKRYREGAFDAEFVTKFVKVSAHKLSPVIGMPKDRFVFG